MKKAPLSSNAMFSVAVRLAVFTVVYISSFNGSPQKVFLNTLFQINAGLIWNKSIKQASGILTSQFIGKYFHSRCIWELYNLIEIIIRQEY